MKNLDLDVLNHQIENVFIKYKKPQPVVNYLKFGTHSVLVIDDWEFYFDKVGSGYNLSSVIDTRHTDDINLHKIKSYIMCDILNNGVMF